jgi:hypothetical protein
MGAVGCFRFSYGAVVTQKDRPEADRNVWTDRSGSRYSAPTLHTLAAQNTLVKDQEARSIKYPLFTGS